MAKIDVTERDKIMLSNIPKLFKMGKFELTGEEIIVTNQVFNYVGSLIKKIDESINEENNKEKTTRKVKVKVEE